MCILYTALFDDDRASYTRMFYWIGLKSDNNGGYVWADGNTAGYFKWAAGNVF